MDGATAHRKVWREGQARAAVGVEARCSCRRSGRRWRRRRRHRRWWRRATSPEVSHHITGKSNGGTCRAHHTQHVARRVRTCSSLQAGGGCGATQVMHCGPRCQPAAFSPTADHSRNGRSSQLYSRLPSSSTSCNGSVHNAGGRSDRSRYRLGRQRRGRRWGGGGQRGRRSRRGWPRAASSAGHEHTHSNRAGVGLGPRRAGRRRERG